VAILVADGFEQVEMTKPREALDEAGAQTKIVSLKPGKIQGMNHADKGDKFDVDLTVDQARPEKFDALLIPGGLFNPDAMRINERAMNFARHFFRESKPVAVICHGPQLLINADLVRGRKMTSWPAIRAECATRVRAGSIRKSSLITDWYRVASPTTFQLSTEK
jgi:protease I